MIKLIQIIGTISLLISANVVVAATIIQVQDNNELTTILTNGKFARMNMSGDEYVIVDYGKQSVKIVSPQKQQVMLLNANNEMAAGKYGPEVHTSIKKLGTGIKVAGYPTQKYAYSANGKSCGVIYGSKDVYQKQGIKELFQAMKTMMEKERAILGGLAGMVDDCTLADMKVSDHVNTIGVPMRTEKNGRIETEIKSIKFGVAIPENTFVIPSSYKVVTMQDQINAASKDMAKMQRYNSQNQQAQMQEMMRQMQQSGQLTPEMMEQMRRSQEMMRQYQQR